MKVPSGSADTQVATPATAAATADPGRRASTAPAPVMTERTFRVGVAAATLLALANALVGIGAHSVARDEGFSISTSLRSWGSLVDLSVSTETNAWLYAFVLKAWSALGTGPGMLRVPSALAFAVTVPLTAALARRLFGARVALIAAVLVAVNGSLLLFANQIRGYAMAVALATAASLVFVAEVRRPTRLTLVGWMVLVVLSAQAQLHTFAVVVPHVVALAALPAAERLWKRRLGALAVGVAVILPVAYSISTNEEGQGLFSLRLGVFRDVLYTFAGRGGVIGVATFAVAGLVLVDLLRRARVAPPGPERFAAVLVGGWVVLPFVGLLVASVVVQPTLIGRYLLHCVPGMTILLALAVDRVLAAGWRRPAAALAAVALMAGAARGSVSWHVDTHTEHWDEVAAFVFAQARPDDRLVVANDSIRLFFEYERTRAATEPPGPQPGYPAAAWGAYGTGDQRYASPTEAEMAAAAAAAGAGRLWVVVGRDHHDTEVMAARLASLAGAFRLVEQRTFPIDIDVYLYERTAP